MHDTIPDALVIIGATVLYLFPPLVAFLGTKKIETKGTDQYFHRLLIQTIKSNGNRFAITIPYLIDTIYVAYPQFLHWIFSFFKENTLDRLAKLSVFIFHLFSSIGLLWFVLKIHPFAVSAGYEISIARLLLVTGAVYAFTPYNYDLINAKNVGISARGLGLFFGQVYLYFIILYDLTDNIWYLVGNILIVFLIYLSSTFSIQFIIFTIIPLMLLYVNWEIGVPLLAALMLSFAFLPKFFPQFIKGQIIHKKIYAQFLAPRLILKKRYSIWRDLFYEFLGQIIISI